MGHMKVLRSFSGPLVFWITLSFALVDQVKQIALSNVVGITQSVEGLMLSGEVALCDGNMACSGLY